MCIACLNDSSNFRTLYARMYTALGCKIPVNVPAEWNVLTLSHIFFFYYYCYHFFFMHSQINGIYPSCLKQNHTRLTPFMMSAILSPAKHMRFKQSNLSLSR